MKEEMIANIEKTKQLKLEIKQILLKLGMMPNLKGFRYWTTAILYIIELEEKGEELGKFMNVYAYVGKKHKSTASKVERDMRYAHQGINLKEKFGTSNSINNTAFLFFVKEKIVSQNNVFC